MQVLVVDDAGFMREIFIQNCRELGAQVIGEAASASEALHIANQYRPDVVIMDLVLPEKNGITVATEILKENPNIEIIATSSLSEEWIEKSARNAGCRFFLKKPFTKNDLKNIFDSIEKERRSLKHG